MEALMVLLIKFPFLTLQAAGAAGMVAHWFKRWFRDQTSLGLLAFFKQNGKAIGGSFLIQFATTMSMFVTGIPVQIDTQTLSIAFLAAFGLNSIFTPHDGPQPKAGEPIK